MAGDIIVSGLTGSRFDGGAMVDQIMQLRSIPIQRLQQQKALIQAKASSMENLAGTISGFLSLFENLDIDSLFAGKKASVSDTDVLSASVTQDAPNISFSVSVNKLSQGEIRVSNGGFSALTDTFANSGTLTINYNTGTGTESFNIDYNAGDTLEDLVNAINNAQNKVKASVYYDGTSYKLMLSESDVGNSTVETDTTNGVYAIEVSGLPTELGTGFDTIQNAQNAQIQIGNGGSITSPDNTFEDVVTGVTIEAKSVGSADVSITDDYSKVTRFLSDFVDKFNATVDIVGALTKGEQALFRGDFTIASVETGIAERLEPLIQAGLIDYNGETGQISLNSDKLNDLLSTDPTQVKEVIQSLKDSYTPYLEGQESLFDSFTTTYSDQIEDIDTRIQSLATRLAQEERILRREYAQLETFIAQAEELRQRFQQFMVSLSQVNGGNKK